MKSKSVEWFKAEIKQKGWSMKALARRWEKSESWVSKIANNPDRGQQWNEAVKGLPNINIKDKFMINKDKDKDNFLLENLDTHVLVVGNTRAGKAKLLKNAKIDNARYYHFSELTELGHLCNDNFEQFDFLNNLEKTLILDGVYISELDMNSKLVCFIKTARKHGKRLIVVTYPEVGELIKPLFGAVIMLSGYLTSTIVSQEVCIR